MSNGHRVFLNLNQNGKNTRANNLLRYSLYLYNDQNNYDIQTHITETIWRSPHGQSTVWN